MREEIGHAGRQRGLRPGAPGTLLPLACDPHLQSVPTDHLWGSPLTLRSARPSSTWYLPQTYPVESLSLPPPTDTGRMPWGSGGPFDPFDLPTVPACHFFLRIPCLLPFTCQLGLFGMPVSWCLCWRGPDTAAHPCPHSRLALAWPHGVCGHPHSRPCICPHPLPGPQTAAHFSDLSSALLPELP